MCICALQREEVTKKERGLVQGAVEGLGGGLTVGRQMGQRGGG